MTRNEVIEILRHCASEDKCPDGIVGNCYGCNRRTALDMAIEALSEDKVFCKDCNNRGREYACPIDELWHISDHDFCSWAERREP